MTSSSKAPRPMNGNKIRVVREPLLETIRGLLQNRESFQTPDNLVGRSVYDYYDGFEFYSTGGLREPWKELFITFAEYIEYVVFSYGVPIAWFNAKNNAWVVPDQDWDSTRQALHGSFVYVALDWDALAAEDAA